MSDVPMSTSGGLAKLAEALAKAQSVMGGAAKDKTNPHFGSKYADLASVMDACREPLAQNGLAVVQTTTSNPDGVAVTTKLLHSSGESIESTFWLPVVQKTPQGYGSALTYARRYSLSALVGVAAEDDDGNAASNAGKPPPPAGVEALKKPKKDDDPVMSAGSAKGKRVSELSDDQLSEYLQSCTTTLADASLAQYHALATHRRACLEAQLRKRGLPL